MASRNPTWKRDELILALDLYFRHHPLQINSSHEEVIKLSNILNNLSIHNVKINEQKFRNPNGVYMKLCNFLRYDPDYKGVGLQRGGKLEEIIWNEFYANKEDLHKIAISIVNNIEAADDEEPSETEEEFPEGKILYRTHKNRERNSKLIKKVKSAAHAKNKLKCEVCGFDFYKFYGEIGIGYIEAHHTLPVSSYTEIAATKIEDIALVCSNCHRMLHRKRPWLAKEELTKLVVYSNQLKNE